MTKLLTGLFKERLKSMMQIDRVTVKHWEKAVWVASWMHDWGKANDHFQTMIRNPSFRQGVRHETISLIMAKEVETWLEPIWDNLSPWSKCAALYSISGHHLKFPDPYAEVRTGTEVALLFEHPDFRHLLQFGCDFFQLPAFPQTEDKVYNLFARGNPNPSQIYQKHLLILQNL